MAFDDVRICQNTLDIKIVFRWPLQSLAFLHLTAFQSGLWSPKRRLDHEQVGKSCDQEVPCCRQEPLQEHLRLDRCFAEGQEGAGHQGVLRSERQDGSGQGSVCQDQGNFGSMRSMKCLGSSSFRGSSRSLCLDISGQLQHVQLYNLLSCW